MKTRIFIGSSKEGLSVANCIKQLLSTDFECLLWTDNLFPFNKSSLESLVQGASLFDIGILVATKDDMGVVREENVWLPRDNVIFELGLFFGRLGANRTFLFQEKDSKIPSDLFGITVSRFEKKANENLLESAPFKTEVGKIRDTIKAVTDTAELGLLPSTALAIGYFENFISILCDSLMSKESHNIEGQIFSEFSLNIVQLSELDTDIKKKATLFYRKNNLRKVSIPAINRDFPVYVSFEPSSSLLKIYDVPTTLAGIERAIELYTKKGYVGKTESHKLLESRELNNFYNTLNILISNNSFSKEVVRFVSDGDE